MFAIKIKHLLTVVGITLATSQGLFADSSSSHTHNKASAIGQADTSTANQVKQPPAGFTQEDINKLSEAFGHFIGRNLNNPSLSFNLESIIKGMRDGYAGAPAPMEDKEYEKMMAKLQESALKQLSEDNLKAANAFMEKNQQTEGVVILEPGKLHYVTLQAGTGPEVTKDSVPQVHYVGKYMDGTVFGSSQELGSPITIPLSQTIKGFSEGLVGMKEGEKRRLFIHPDLGYGTTGQLPPNALLIFEIEIVKADNPDYKNNALSNLNNDLDDDDADENDDLDDEDNDDNDNDDEEDDSRVFRSSNMTEQKTPMTSPSSSRVR